LLGRFVFLFTCRFRTVVSFQGVASDSIIALDLWHLPSVMLHAEVSHILQSFGLGQIEKPLFWHVIGTYDYFDVGIQLANRNFPAQMANGTQDVTLLCHFSVPVATSNPNST